VDEFKQKPLLFPTIAAQKNGLIIHMMPSIVFSLFFFLSKLMKLLLLNKRSDGTQNQRAKDPI
jgi:hypothetical protein